MSQITSNYTYMCNLTHARQTFYVPNLTDEYQTFSFSATYPYIFTGDTITTLNGSLVNCEMLNDSAIISLDKLLLTVQIKGTNNNASFDISAFNSSQAVYTSLLGYAQLAPSLLNITNTTSYYGILSSSNNRYKIDHTTVSIILGTTDITSDCYNTEDGSVRINMPALLKKYAIGNLYIYADTKLVEFNHNKIGDYINADLIKYYINNNISQQQFRICVLYPDETINYEIPIEDIQLGGSYSENYQNGQRRTLSFALYNNDGKYTPNINTFWAGTRLRLDVGIKALDNTVYWFQKGIFVINSATPSLGISNKVVNISAGDKFSLFENATGKLSGTYEIPANTDIESLILDILHTNMGDGYLLDPQKCLYNAAFKGKKTQVIISKNAGDTFGSILLDIASQLSAEIYYNENGNLVLIPIAEVTDDKDKPLLFSFETQKGDMSGLDFTFDYNSIVNRVIVIGTSSSGGTYTAEAVNNDPGSPLCYQRIGYRTGEIINDNNIYSRTLAEERAEYELRQQLILKSSTSASIAFNPLLKVNNLIAISDEFFNLNHERFLLQSISYSLNYSNQMSITFSNLNNLPFAI